MAVVNPAILSGMPNRIYYGDNLTLLRSMKAASIDLIYVDPPFNTGRAQKRSRLKTIRDEVNPDRRGFKGQGYRTVKLGEQQFSDRFDDFQAFLMPRMFEASRVLKPTGSLFLHLNAREVHHAKVWMDELFGRDSFINEIIWAYDYGARSKSRWPAKHDNILWYAKDPGCYTFNYDAMDRIPYMAPGLVGKEKAARGKTPTDVWWQTIVSPTGKEKTGYPTQKPLAILDRIVRVHSNRGETVLDFFAGSGTTGQAAEKNDRRFVLCDASKHAIDVMRKRLPAAVVTNLDPKRG